MQIGWWCASSRSLRALKEVSYRILLDTIAVEQWSVLGINTSASHLNICFPYFAGDSAPRSVEGQVQHLLMEAMDPDNLSRMYCGWQPYL